MLKKDIGKKCIAPWIHLHTWPNKNVFPCCMTSMHDVVGNLGTQTLEEIWNSPKMRQLRLDMLADKENDMCKRCWVQERSGHPTMRTMLNREFEHLLNRWDETKPDGSAEYAPVYWDFRFSNICNMRCRSCGPQLSSGWYEDTKKRWGKLPSDVADLTDRTPELWDQLEPLFETVEEIYFAGGEPLIMEEHYRILKRLDQMGRHDVRLKYNTNFSKMRYKSLDAIEMWNRFESVEIGASLDSWGSRAEYIRKGTVWPETVANIERLKCEAPSVKFFISCTVGTQNVLSLTEYIELAVDSGWIEPGGFHINPIQDPVHLNPQILPRQAKLRLQAEWSKWLESPRWQHTPLQQTLPGLARFMLSEDLYHSHWSVYERETGVWDRIRGESWRDTFPELVEEIEQQ